MSKLLDILKGNLNLKRILLKCLFMGKLKTKTIYYVIAQKVKSFGLETPANMKRKCL